MTTDTRLSPSEEAAEITRKHISTWQRGYLADEPYAVAALARLRRGAGKEAGQVPDLWGLIDTGPLHDLPPGEGGWRLRERDVVRAEDAVHVALTLWALHQQSRGAGMHRPNRQGSLTGLGAAVRRLMPLGEIDQTVLKRLVRAGNAPDLPVLAQRLREIVLLLRREDIALDYGLLTEQMCRWQRPGGRDTVRRAWGSSFHAYRAADDSMADVPAGPARDINPTVTGTDFKDAS